jgi:hypothetical protein
MSYCPGTGTTVHPDHRQARVDCPVCGVSCAIYRRLTFSVPSWGIIEHEPGQGLEARA